MAAVALVMSITTAAALSDSSGRWNGWAPYENHYLNLYEQCWHRFDKECGRNLVDDGFRQDSGKVRAPTEGEVKTASARLDATLHPPEPVAASVSESVAPAPAATTVAPTSGGTPPAYIAQCESGGSYTAVNPSSGAYGKWQIMPSTSASYGCDMSTPAGQDACAAKIYAAEGSSPWACG